MTPDSFSPRGDHPPLHGVPGDSRNTRREARELALRMLFQLDLGKQPITEVVEAALAQSHLEGANRQYSEELVRGALNHLAEIDARITVLTPDWTPERQAAVDRNILRLAAYELLHRPDAPVAVVVNEAVELAKKYSTAESGRFVNGVLGALARQPRGEHAGNPGEHEGSTGEGDEDGRF